jgi:inorganic triphosphatase YgiF
MATVSMTQAATLVGKSKGTLSKALKSGRLSYAEKTDNGYLIEISELYRVFPKKPSEQVAQVRLETAGATAKFEVDALRREAEMLRSTLDDVRADRDAWRDQAQRLLLEGPAVQPVARRGLFGWFRRD